MSTIITYAQVPGWVGRSETDRNPPLPNGWINATQWLFDSLDVSRITQVEFPFYGVVDPLSAKQGRATDDFDFVYLRLLGVELEVAPDLD